MKIESYDFGQIVIDGKKYTGDLIIYPDRIIPPTYLHTAGVSNDTQAGGGIIPSWWRKEGHSLCNEDIKDVISKKPEVIIIGAGCYGCMVVPEGIRKQIEGQNIKLIVEKTSDAIKLWNNLKDKDAVACLHLTC